MTVVSFFQAMMMPMPDAQYAALSRAAAGSTPGCQGIESSVVAGGGGRASFFLRGTRGFWSGIPSFDSPLRCYI